MSELSDLLMSELQAAQDSCVAAKREYDNTSSRDGQAWADVQRALARAKHEVSEAERRLSLYNTEKKEALAMPDIEITVKDGRTITIPKIVNPTDTEQIGKFLVNAGQDGYGIKSVSAITREVGTQRDPLTETQGVKITVSR